MEFLTGVTLSTVSDVLCIGYVLYSLFYKNKPIVVLVRDEDWAPGDVETDSEDESCSDENTTRSVSGSYDDYSDDSDDDDSDDIDDDDSDGGDSDDDDIDVEENEVIDLVSDSQSEHGSMPPPLETDSDSDDQMSDSHEYMSDSSLGSQSTPDYVEEVSLIVFNTF